MPSTVRTTTAASRVITTLWNVLGDPKTWDQAVELCAAQAALACDPSSWPNYDNEKCGSCKALVNWNTLW